jgi:excisionase family DNA binding protein
MITANRIQDPLDRLATVAERYMDFLERETRANENQKEQPEERMLTPLEAARILRINVQTVMTWCREGKNLKGIKVGGNETNGKGGKWLIPREEIDAYLRRDRLINGTRKGGAK